VSGGGTGEASVLVAGALALMAGGCLSPHSVPCSDGRFCPAGTECDVVHQTCISPSEQAACANKAEGDTCTLSLAMGVCRGGACQPYRCGDGIRTGTESCDGTDLGTASCATLGFYGETTGLACADACTFDTTGCVGACGDQMKNGPELCDGSDLGGADCRTAGFYDAPGLQCSPFCTFDVSACTGYCGDAKINGPELCDGSPPPGQTCLSNGFDRGFLGCSAVCGVAFDGCGQLGWKSLSLHSDLVLTGVWTAGPRDAFAVGRGGTIWHWDGSSWAAMASPTTQDLRGVWGSASNDVYTVGGAGTILHWDGETWSAMTSPTMENLNGVWGSGPDDVFAVGGIAVTEASSGPGAIFHWDGSTWSTMTAPATDDLHGVWGSGPDDVFAVGWATSILHWDGRAWSAMPSPGGGWPLNSVWGSGPKDVFAVGFDSILHWDGATWSRSTVGGWFVGVWGTGPDDVYAFGGAGASGNPGPLIHWNGSMWSVSATNVPYDASGNSQSLGGVGGSGPDDVFVVGPPNLIFHGNGTAWTTTTTAASLGITGAWGSDPDHVYAVGNGLDSESYEEGFILTFNGNAWSSAEVPSETLNGITGSGSEAVIAGQFDVSHLDGAGLTSQGTRVSGFTGLDAWESGPDDVFVVGVSQNSYAWPGIIHWDGNSWSSPTLPAQHRTATGLSGVWGSGPSDVFAVGTGGNILHWDGVAWEAQTSGSTQDLNDVWGSGPNDVFAVGNAGTILHFDGQTWSPIDAGTTDDLWGVGSSGPADIFVTSTYALLHRRAGTWEQIALPMAAQFRTLWVTPSRVFLFGTKGEIARLDRYTVTCVAPEQSCGDGWDNDCDGLVDADDPDCAGKVAEQCANGIDDDGDGAVDCADPDCASFPTCRKH
jgi:hypothetical protein